MDPVGTPGRNTPVIDASVTLETLFRAYPSTLDCFVTRGMLCPGCPITPWHTVRDACAEYRLDEVTFLAGLRRVARREDGP